MKYFYNDAKTAEAHIKDMFSPTQASSLPSDILKNLSTDKITVVAAYLGDNPDSQIFGHLIGYAKLDKPIILEQRDLYDKEEHIHVETEYIHFFYRVYLPNRSAEYMSTIKPYYTYDLIDFPDDNDHKKMLQYSRENERARIQLEEFSWGAMGFWEETDTDDLSGDDLACRLFIEKVQKVSKEQKWQKRLKKLAQKKEKEESTNTAPVFSR